MSFGRINFNFNPLNGHYLNPPIFPKTRAKEEKKPLSKSSKKCLPKRNSWRLFFWDTWGCTDSEKLKIFLLGLLSYKGPFLEFYDQTIMLSFNCLFTVVKSTSGTMCDPNSTSIIYTCVKSLHRTGACVNNQCECVPGYIPHVYGCIGKNILSFIFWSVFFFCHLV